MRVVVGLSGGFDSFMAGYLLKLKGHELLGVTMRIWDGHVPCVKKRNACLGPDEEEDIENARKVAEILSIPHFVVDLRREYRDLVVEYFRSEYASGRTPNPCVLCNSKIKFGFLLERVRSLGIRFDFFATGHYARVEYDLEKGRYLLKRGVDTEKDQSYFLYRLTQDQLRHVLFPVGCYRKKELRELALSSGFGELAQKKESQDFFSDDYILLLQEKKGPGDILDLEGRVIGKHKGVHRYTVGQRRHLNLRGLKEPFYVLRIDAERNEIVAGPRRYLFKKSLFASTLNWVVPVEQVREKILFAQVRYKSSPTPCKIHLQEGGVLVEFFLAQEGIAPGQSVVFYDGDVVVGGGTIEWAE